MTEGTQFCISCGEIFHPANPTVLLCLACGGPPEARLEDPVDLTEMPRVELQPSREPGTGSDWQPGDVILDTYEVKAVLGQGGFGKVYRVHHRAWNVDLAVKRSLNLEESSKQAFIEEAEKWINLGLHPHIVSCYYVRNIDGFPHTFAELAEGGSLKDWIEGEERKLYAGGSAAALERILDVAIQFAWGLGYAHEQGLVHQDVKPGNVLMTPDGVAKVTDFGLAKARQPTIGGDLLVSTAGGTQAFRSPEQARGDRLSIQTDIWSWAVSILEMFTGELVWQYGEAAAEVLEGFLDESAQVPGPPLMPEALAELLRQCFRRDPSERPKDMLVIADGLQEIFQQESRQPYPRQAPKPAELRSDSLNNQALSLLDLGQTEKAMTAWQKALHIDAHHLEATYNQGLTLWRGATLSDELLLEKLNEVSASHRGDWEPSFLIGQVHLERGDKLAAGDVLKCIKETDSKRAEIATALRLARNLEGTTRQHLLTFEGHKSGVNAVCLSIDGHHAMSGSLDGSLKLWDVKSGSCLRTFEGHALFINSVDLSSDGCFALSGSSDKSLKLWDIERECCIFTFQGHKSAVISVCFSTDGQFALSGSGDKTLKLWDITSSHCLRTFEGHTGGVTSVRLSSDGHYALSGSYDNTLKLWEVESGRCLRTFRGNEDDVTSVCLSVDGHYALSGSEDRKLKLWEVESGRCLSTLQVHSESEFFHITSVFMSADSRFALSGCTDGTLILWELESGRCLRTFRGHEDVVTSVCLSVDGLYALSGSWDKTLKLWDVELSLQSLKSPYVLSRVKPTEELISGQAAYEKALNLSKQALKFGQAVEAAKHLRVARKQPEYQRAAEALELWCSLYICFPHQSLRTGWEIATLEGHTEWVSSVCMSLDGRFALSGSHDNTLKLWDLANKRCLRTYEGHERIVTAVCLSSDGRYALSGSEDKTLKLWEVESGQCLRCVRTFDGYKDQVTSVSVNADGRYALYGSWDNTLKLWNMESGQCLHIFEGHKDYVNSICLSPDGRYTLSGSRDNTLKLWDLEEGSCIRTFEGHRDGIYSVCMGADGRYALSGSRDMTIKMWDIEKGDCIHTFEGHKNDVRSVFLSADGRYVLSGSSDKTLKLWDVESGGCLRTFEGHTNWVTSVCMSADGRYVLSGCGDKTLKLWALDWELEDREQVNWDVGAQPYLKTFLTLHPPIRRGLFKTLKLTWTEKDFTDLLYTLGCAGYGWLRPEGVRSKLEEMAKER